LRKRHIFNIYEKNKEAVSVIANQVILIDMRRNISLGFISVYKGNIGGKKTNMEVRGILK